MKVSFKLQIATGWTDRDSEWADRDSERIVVFIGEDPAECKIFDEAPPGVDPLGDLAEHLRLAGDAWVASKLAALLPPPAEALMEAALDLRLAQEAGLSIAVTGPLEVRLDALLASAEVASVEVATATLSTKDVAS